MLQLSARNQRMRIDQRLDHRVVGVAIFALVGENSLSGEARRFLGEGAVLVDRVGNARVDSAGGKFSRRRHPDVEVFAAVARRGVHEARACVVGDMAGGEQRRVEHVAAAKAFERMRAFADAERFDVGVAYARELLDFGAGESLRGELVGDNIARSDARPIALRRSDDLIDAVLDAG